VSDDTKLVTGATLRSEWRPTLESPPSKETTA
jgi:hypothetical protein